jgi:hypothetical protein
MTKTEKLTDLVEQASNKNPLMAAGIIKQAAGLSADILSEHERRLETCAGAVGQISGGLRALTEAYSINRGLLDAALLKIDVMAKLVAELAARNGMAAHFAESTAPGVIVEGEYTHG